MNHGTITGGVVKEASPAYVPGSMVKKILLTIATSDSHRQPSFWNCEAEDPTVCDYLEREAQRGRGIKIDYELATRPYIQHGVHKGEIRFLRVLAAEVAPPRHNAAEALEEVET